MQRPLETVDDLRTWELERSLPHGQVVVFDAVTDREEMRQWSAVEIEGERSLGAPVTVVRRDGVESENGRVVAYERPRLFSYVIAGRTLSFEVIARDEGGVTLQHLVSLAADATAPADHAAWDRERAVLAAELDALEAYLAGAHAGMAAPSLMA